MASDPITSWQIDEETVETVTDFIFLGSKVTANGDCSHQIKRCLPLGRKVMTNLDSILKTRDITLPTKVHLVKAMVCPVVMYGCESWTIKKAEHRNIHAFELWCWRRLLRVPWTARRPTQSILKEISPEYSLEGLMLKLKLQYFGHLMRRYDSFEKTLMLGKIEGRRRRGPQRMRWLDGITDSMDMSLSSWGSRSWWWTGKPGMVQSMGSQRVRHDWVSELETGWRKKNIITRKGKDYPQTPILRWNKCWNYLTKTFFYISLVFFHKIASNKKIKYLVCTCIHRCTSDIFLTNSLIFLKKSKNMSGSSLAFC